jgi:hypothetical protein
MDNLSGCKVVHMDSRRRIALQCVDLLLSGAAPARRALSLKPGVKRIPHVAPRQNQESLRGL